jgi:hypothetical protein
LLPKVVSRLRDIALFFALIGAGAVMGASAPLLAGEEADGATHGPTAIDKRVLASPRSKTKSHKRDKKKHDKKKSKQAAREQREKRKKDHATEPHATPNDGDGSFDSTALAGRTIDFEYDGRDVHMPSLAYSGRVFVPERVIAEGKPVPLVVFFHGLNKALIRHRWMGGGKEGDVRRIVLSLVESGQIPPVIVAGPGSVQPDAVSDGASFPVFDFDKFMRLTTKSLEGVAEIDASRVIVTGHSGAGCSESGGIVSALHAATVPSAVVSIDTCMGSKLALSLAGAPLSTDVVVTWETASWDRDFAAFKATFEKAVASHDPASGLRELDELPTQSHDATVALTMKKYLPLLLK